MTLNVAVAIFRLQPAGGLEQHALRLAAELVRRGHRVTIITTVEPASLPADIDVRLLSRRGRTNHGRMAAFLEDATDLVAAGYDRTVSFHAGGSFDILFCGDVCRRVQWRGLHTLLSSRRRAYLAMEAEAFAPNARTVVLGLASVQLDAFAAVYGTPWRRLIVLPPTVDRLRAQPTKRCRQAGRALVWLWAGLAPKTKGLDRVLNALKHVPEARLVVCGCDRAGRQGRRAMDLSVRLGVEARVEWAGFVADGVMPELMGSADLLVHPARLDTTGTVILEALVNGLPVVTTAVCGYAEHVAKAGAGVVLPEPFRREAFISALSGLQAETIDSWGKRALAYAADPRLFSGIERAADIIEAGGEGSTSSAPLD